MLGFDAKGFTAFIDVHLFEPNEISVKTIDHTIMVECNHDSRSDSHGPVERHFVRKFNLPLEYGKHAKEGEFKLVITLPSIT